MANLAVSDRWLIQPHLLDVTFLRNLSNVLCINKFSPLWLEGNKMIPGAVGYGNCLSHNTVVIVFFLERVLAWSHKLSTPTNVQMCIQPKTQGEPFPDLGNSFPAQLPLLGKCVLQILATSVSLNASVGPLKSIKLSSVFWIPLSALQFGSCLQMKAWNEVGCISFVFLLSGIQACAACCSTSCPVFQLFPVEV